MSELTNIELFLSFMRQHPWLYFVIYQIVGFMGMASHFLKIKAYKQTKDTITRYYTCNWAYSLLAIIVTIISTFTAWSSEQGIMAAFLGGYTFDSFLNRDSSYTTMYKPETYD
jgi:hypothetical protein